MTDAIYVYKILVGHKFYDDQLNSARGRYDWQ